MAFTITKTDCYATHTLSSTTGTYDQATETINLSVGADLTITMQSRGPKVVEMFYGFIISNSFKNTILRSADLDTGEVLTGYSLNSGKVDNPDNPAHYISWVPKVPFSSITIKSYIGIPTSIPAPRTELFYSYYLFDGPSGNPDPVCVKNVATDELGIEAYVNVDIPTATSTFTPPSGSNAFQFGPFLHTSAGTILETPVAWNNTSYLNPPAGSTYVFGCMSSPVSAWKFQGAVTNGTNSTGYAYFTQLVRILNQNSVTYAKTNCNAHIYEPVLKEDGYLTEVTRPTDASGIVKWAVDGETNISPFPWAYSTQAFTQFPANSGALAVPPLNSIQDLNGTFQSYHTDNPFRRVAVTPPLSDTLIELNVNWQFVTHLVFHPDGGIPISLAQYRWYLDCNQYNATADRTGLLADSVYTQANWDLTKTYQTLGSNSFVPTYLQWFYNQWDYRGNVVPGRWVPRPKKAGGGAPNVGPMGTGPMGGAVTVPNFGNMALLPRGSGVNVGGMNSV